MQFSVLVIFTFELNKNTLKISPFVQHLKPAPGGSTVRLNVLAIQFRVKRVLCMFVSRTRSSEQEGAREIARMLFLRSGR